MTHAKPVFSDRRLVMSALPQSPWANQMVLNPGVIRDPQTDRLHMLFRATGSGQPDGQSPSPGWGYPIYLGYAYSDDSGASWHIDDERPALSPKLATARDELLTTDLWGRPCVDFANGCIEDPRLFWFDGQCHLIVACRVFPPGPYWIVDDPMQCAPSWVRDASHGLGRAVKDNVTVNLLYRVDLHALASRQYDRAFSYVTHLTDPEHGENRDVLLFPRPIVIGGQPKIVCLHRPWESHHFPGGSASMKPSIWYSVADSLDELATGKASHRLLVEPILDWEDNRIGASAPPVEIAPGRWLVSYHGKQDARAGYTQSVLIVEEDDEAGLIVRHRCAERLLVPRESWEMPSKFKTPCLFVTALLAEAGRPWQVFYGAADERVGMAACDGEELLRRAERYDARGCLVGGVAETPKRGRLVAAP
ncbi:MAG: hypothetical protein AAF823_01755 [Planctomycetota bacterium]